MSNETTDPQLPFQQRVQPWMMECFGPMIAGDREERNHRFLEEALELVQSTGCSASEANQLVDYVYGRPVGEPVQEVGGVMVTLAALCLANDMDMHAAAETELARIWTKVEQIRAKQAAKPKHSPLPAAATSAGSGWRQLGHSEVRAIYRAWQQAEETPMGLFNRFREAATAPQQHAQAALREVREAVLTYYDALTARQHGGVAQDKAFNAIQQALGLSWQFGVDHRAASQQPAAAPAAPAAQVQDGELLPCPFCAAAPLMQEHEPHSHSRFLGIPDHPGSFTVECPTDGCCGMIADTKAQAVVAWNRRAALSAKAQAMVVTEPCAPHILEAISYYAGERDDLSLEDAVKALRFGWRTVSGRSERAMLLQIVDLLASAPAAPSPAQAQPVAFAPGGVRALADVTGQPVMYGDQEVQPRAQPVAEGVPVEAKPVEGLLTALKDISEACNCCGDRADLAEIAKGAIDAYAAQPSTAQGEAMKIAKSAISLRALYHNTHCNPEGFQLQVETNAVEAEAFIRSLAAKPAEGV